MDKRIWVLGSLNLDTTFQVACLPEKGATTMIQHKSTALGGKGANAAVVCARSGAAVSLIGCVGRDEAGDALRVGLTMDGIDTENLIRLDGVPSGTAYITVDVSGANTVLVNPGANQEIPLGLTPGFSPGGLFVTQFEVNRSSVLHYLRMAAKAGMKSLLNPSPFALDREAFSLADFLVVNEVEMEMLAGNPVPLDAEALAAQKVAEQYGCAVVVTLGRRGALLAQDGQLWRVGEYSVKAIDTQGAGDTFLGVFAASLLDGLAPQQALLRANVAASISVTCHGSAQQSFPELKLVNSEYLRLLEHGALRPIQ